MKKNTLSFLSCTLFAILFVLSACKNRDLNYISYYNKVNEIDSIYRFQKDTLAVIKRYKKLFKQYPPKSQDRIEEYETYIKLADLYHKNFGGKKSLYKLIPLVAPNWKYKKEDVHFMQLYEKYGINSQEMEGEVLQWKKNLNKKLVDSFTVVFNRDQSSRKNTNVEEMLKNDKKNAELLKWMFENYGFPGIQKIGLWNGDLLMPSGAVFLHMADYEEYLPYFRIKILEYVKSGECPPRDYAVMIDRNDTHHKMPYTYGVYQGHENIKDSAVVNRNRKSIGLPSLKHSQAIIKDFIKKNKKEK